MFANEYTQIIQRFINLSQLVGLAPMIINLKLSGNFTISKLKYAMSAFYLLIQIGHAIFQVMRIYDEIRLSTMSQIIHFVWMFHCLSTHISVAVQSLFVSTHLMDYINQLCAIDLVIHSELRIVKNYRQQSRKHSLIMMIVLTLSFGLTWTLYGFVAHFHPELVSLFAFIFIPTGFMSIRVVQMIHSIEMLNDHLDTINNRLRSIDAGDNGKEELIVLRRLYGQCWNAMQLYNFCFGFSNLMLLLFYSYDVLHGIYILFLNMYGLRPDLVILYGIVFLPSAINLFAITNAAERCRHKAKETGIRLGNIWTLPDCHVHLKRFSVQVIHQQYLTTACGFFVVNFKCLGGLVVGYSNLLLLFIQFEISEKTV